MECHEKLQPDTQCTNFLLVLNTTESKDLAAQCVPGEMFFNKTDGKVANNAKSDESFSPTLTLSESSIENQYYQEGAQACSGIQSAHDSTETEVRSLTNNILLETFVYLTIG
jgi:hypothetical protein